MRSVAAVGRIQNLKLVINYVCIISLYEVHVRAHFSMYFIFILWTYTISSIRDTHSKVEGILIYLHKCIPQMCDKPIGDWGKRIKISSHSQFRFVSVIRYNLKMGTTKLCELDVWFWWAWFYPLHLHTQAHTHTLCHVEQYA